MAKLDQILANVLKIEIASIADELRPEDVEAWDSMNAMILVAELEKAYKIRFTSEDVIDVTCVGDIKKIIIKYGADPHQ